MFHSTSKNRIIRIVFAPDGGRFRDPVTRSRARPTFKVPSIKLNRMAEAESENEVNVFTEKECDPGVVSYLEQPCEITYLDGDEEKRHIPDILDKYADLSKALVEVKTAEEANSREVRRRTEILREDLPHYGYTYEVRLAEEAAKEPFHKIPR